MMLINTVPIEMKKKSQKIGHINKTSIKFIDKEKNVSQFNPDEYFF